MNTKNNPFSGISPYLCLSVTPHNYQEIQRMKISRKKGMNQEGSIMYRHNHNSRCSECTRYNYIRTNLGSMMDDIPLSPRYATIMCNDCWFNEDVR